MREITYSQKNNIPIVLALGFFDCLHIGHKAVLDACRQSAIRHNAKTAVATFLNNPSDKDKLVYTYAERKIKLEEQKIDIILGINFDNDFSKLNHDDFLDSLFDNYNIKAIICGFDYRYGENRLGDCNALRAKCQFRNIPVTVIGEVTTGLKKISSTLIKSILSEGEIETANALLSSNYTVSQIVVRGRGQGRQIGVPTANIILHGDKHNIKEGVYGTYAHINGKKFKAVTNAGAAPTFGESNHAIETHIMGFDMDIYGKPITVEFIKRLRDIKKFDSVAELIEQIEIDCRW